MTKLRGYIVIAPLRLLALGWHNFSCLSSSLSKKFVEISKAIIAEICLSRKGWILAVYGKSAKTDTINKTLLPF
jgi:hypothetical protein